MSNIELLDRTEITRAVQQCLLDTGAIKPCSHCGAGFQVAHNDAAERHAYDRAADLWMAGLRGFEGLTRGEVGAAVRSTLDGVRRHCPNC